MNIRLVELISAIETYREASNQRTEFYESPDNRSIVLTHNEDFGTYSCRRSVDREYHDALNELKKVLKAFGLTYELGWSGIFYDNYFNTSARQKESRTVKNALKYFELGSLIPEWVIACSMGAKMRRLQRHYGNNAWWKKNIGRKYHERPQAYIYKSEHNKQYLLQRKVVFKAIRECARKQKMDYKLFPLDPKKMFTISFFE